MVKALDLKSNGEILAGSNPVATVMMFFLLANPVALAITFFWLDPRRMLHAVDIVAWASASAAAGGRISNVHFLFEASKRSYNYRSSHK